MTCVDVATFIGREITTVLKIAVDNVILELWNSCDYFATPLLNVKKQLNLIVIFKKESCNIRSVRPSCYYYYYCKLLHEECEAINSCQRFCSFLKRILMPHNISLISMTTNLVWHCRCFWQQVTNIEMGVGIPLNFLSSILHKFLIISV